MNKHILLSTVCAGHSNSVVGSKTEHFSESKLVLKFLGGQFLTKTRLLCNLKENVTC